MYKRSHRPFHDDAKHQPRWTDGAGRQVPAPFRTAAGKRRIRAFPARGARVFATLNHYALRSLESYLVKNDRGDVNREHRAFDDTYWRERNDAAWRDESILRYLPALHEELARLKALPGVGALHAKAVAAHRRPAAAPPGEPACVQLQHPPGAMLSLITLCSGSRTEERRSRGLRHQK